MNEFSKSRVLYAIRPLRLSDNAFIVVFNEPEYDTRGKFNLLNNLCFSVLNGNICITGQVVPRLLGNLACLTATVTDSHVHG